MDCHFFGLNVARSRQDGRIADLPNSEKNSLDEPILFIEANA